MRYCIDCDGPTKVPTASRCKRCYLRVLIARHRRTRAKRARAASITARWITRSAARLLPTLVRHA